MQPVDQDVTIFIVAVFAVFSAVLAYATWLGAAEKKRSSIDKRR